MSRLLHPLYHLLARSGMMRYLVPDRLRPRVVLFEANGRSHLRLMLGHRIAGSYDARQRRWDIRRPFRLFVDEQGLPKAETVERTSLN
jgi:signal peptidase